MAFQRDGTVTFTEWLALRRRSSTTDIGGMRQLEAWEAGRRELQSDLEPVLFLAKELAGALQRASAEGNWVGVPEVLSEARRLGLIRRAENWPPVTTVVGHVRLG
jgi:hypothetical protein